MSSALCDNCGWFINTDDEPDCWRKALKSYQPGVAPTIHDVPFCKTCREARDASQERARHRRAAGVDLLDTELDIDRPGGRIRGDKDSR